MELDDVFVKRDLNFHTVEREFEKKANFFHLQTAVETGEK